MALVAVLSALAVAIPAAASLAPLAGGGSGNLHLLATGPAAVDVQGKIVAWGALPTPARIEVKGKQGTFSVRIGGVLQKSNRRGVVRLENASGPFAVQGAPGVRIRVEGTGFDMSIAGRGSALPAGAGTYSLNGAPYVAWTGQPITIAPPGRVRKPPGKQPQPTVPNNSGRDPGDSDEK